MPRDRTWRDPGSPRDTRAPRSKGDKTGPQEAYRPGRAEFSGGAWDDPPSNKKRGGCLPMFWWIAAIVVILALVAWAMDII